MKYAVCRTEFHNFSVFHYGKRMAKVADHSHIVTDEDVGEVVMLLEFLEQCCHLELYGPVQR